MARKHLGISLYPEFFPREENIAYLERAAGYGFDQLFLAIFMTKESRGEILDRYRPLCDRAKELGYEIACDLNPAVFPRLGVNASAFHGPLDLSFFEELHFDIMRLDLGMTAMEEAMLTKNEAGIKVCLNTGSPWHVDEVLLAGADRDKLLGCHNYYPHRYTGMTQEFFDKGSEPWIRNHLRLQAFVTSTSPDARGPWPVTEGLPTLEAHRDLPIAVQMKHFVLMPGVTDVYIANAFATDEELAAMAAANSDVVTFTVEPAEGLPEDMRAHAQMPLSRRGDSSAWLCRTLESRFAGKSFEPFNTVAIRRGDVVLDNRLYGQYDGELQIALRDMENDGKANVLGRIVPEEHMLLDYVTGSCAFRLAFDA